MKKERREEKRKSSKILRYAKKIKAFELLGNKCEFCGNNDFFNLCFHHFSNDKEDCINKMKAFKWSEIKREVLKCKLLCHNCHNELHFSGKENTRFYENKKILLEWKGDFECVECGYNKCNSSLHFHHENEKNFGIGFLIKSKTKNTLETVREKIIEEINKCSVICSNCHIKKHFDTEFFEKYKDEIYAKSKNIKDGTSKVDRDLIKKMYQDEGLKQIEISKKLKISKGTVSGIIKELKLK